MAGKVEVAYAFGLTAECESERLAVRRPPSSITCTRTSRGWPQKVSRNDLTFSVEPNTIDVLKRVRDSYETDVGAAAPHRCRSGCLGDDTDRSSAPYTSQLISIGSINSKLDFVGHYLSTALP
jgi:hypothetical protein